MDLRIKCQFENFKKGHRSEDWMSIRGCTLICILTASGKKFQIPEVDYEGAYELQDDEELVEYDDAVSTQQMMKCYKPPPVTEAYEDVDL
jgi:hypothetical protein